METTKERSQPFLKLWWSNIGSLFSLSLLYSIVSILLLPCGLASAGMADITGKIVREYYTVGLMDSMATVKRCWKQALGIGILNLVFSTVLIFAGWFYLSATGIIGAIGIGFCSLASIIFSFMKYYIWAQIVIFKLPFRVVYKNAFFLVFINFKRNLLIGGISLACYALAVLTVVNIPYSIVLAAVIMLGSCVFPGFKQLLVQYCVLPCLKKYVIDPYHAQHTKTSERQ